jgi:hypothetical protein
VVDLAQYLCAPGPTYLLSGIGTEHCQLQREPSGYVYQVKNGNAETLWFDSTYIYRGLDTSPNEHEVYAQFTGDVYGAPWARRFMNIGEAFQRTPTIRWWKRNGEALPQRTASVIDWIRLVRHYPSFQSPFGITVLDVIELHWLPTNAGGTPALESYFYARGVGLVGFGGGMGRSGIAALNVPRPTREILPWFREPLPPPTQQPGELPFQEGVVQRIPGSYINVRRTPDVGTNNVVGRLEVNDEVRYRDAGDWYEVEYFIPVRGFVSKQTGRVVIE